MDDEEKDDRGGMWTMLVVGLIGIGIAIDALVSGEISFRLTGSIRLNINSGDGRFLPYVLFLGLGSLALAGLSARRLLSRD
jgi:hypothetical protein